MGNRSFVALVSCLQILLAVICIIRIARMILSIQSEPKLGRSEEYLHIEIGGSSLADTLYKEGI